MHNDAIIVYRGKHNGVFMFNAGESQGPRINIVDTRGIYPADLAPVLQEKKTPKQDPQPTTDVKEIAPTDDDIQRLILEMQEAYRKWMRVKGNISLLNNRELVLAKKHCTMPNVDFDKLVKELA